MSSEEDLLKLLDEATARHIKADYDRYRPLIALLGAWKEEIDGHVTQIEENVVVRLMQELFPKGAWRFPAQTLAVPDNLIRREVGEETTFTDRATGTPWTPCGQGWTLPTRLESWSIEQHGWDSYALVCDIHMENRQPDARLLVPPQPPDDPLGQMQLAFVCAGEAVVADLARSAWGVQHPGEPVQPIRVTRYRGYLDFEMGIAAARKKQRQLEAWLPPFFPYARKFLRFYLPDPRSEPAITADRDAWGWLGAAQKTVRLVALIPERTADYFLRNQADPPLILNAIPMAQMRATGDALRENPDRVGDSHRIPFMGYAGAFAASGREYKMTADGVQVVYHPVQMHIAASEDPNAKEGLQNIDVWCDRPSGNLSEYRVRIYHECYGEKAATPRVLTRPNMTYSLPFPLLGSMDASVVGYGDQGAKRDWYHSLIRAPQLTQGDILEILTQIPDCNNCLDLDPDYFFLQLDIDNEPGRERSGWENYLWPTVVSEASLLEHRVSYLTRSRVAIIPLMRLIFSPGRKSLPAFLWEDLMDYTASVISKYFMLGWYRVVAEKARE